MNKPTPGPWSIGPVEGDPQARALTCRFFFGPEGLAIFRMGLGYEPPEADDANARLIAAAPELLEALKQAYDDCIRFLNYGDFKRNVEWDAGYIVDAIAKAEGREVPAPMMEEA